MKDHTFKISSLAAACLLSGMSVSAQTPENSGGAIDSQKVTNISVRENSVIAPNGATPKRNPNPSTGRNNQSVSLRSRTATPPPQSIYVDRDTSNWGVGNYHPKYHSYTPEQLVKEVLLGDARAANAITNVKFRGTGWNGTAWTVDNRSLHYFENGDSIDVKRGLLLATGQALNAEGSNSGSGSMSTTGTPISLTGDPDLEKICPPDGGISQVYSGSILEFDFVPYMPQATFDFVFASEEYGDYSNVPQYNDAFGFFVSKAVNPTDTINIARFPNDSLVTISNSNWGYRNGFWGGESQAAYSANPPFDTTGYHAALAWNPVLKGMYVSAYSPIAVNPQWHVPNYISVSTSPGSPYMEYDGRTVLLKAVAANLTPGEKYHLKLAICNRGDHQLGSAVFLANLDLGAPSTSVDISYWDVASIDSMALDAYGEATSMYDGCLYPIKAKFVPQTQGLYPIDVEIEYLNIDSSAVIDEEGKPLQNKFQLTGPTDTVRTYNIKMSSDFSGFVNGQYVGLLFRVVGGGVDTAFYKQLFEPVTWNVDYYPSDGVNSGHLNLGIRGGSTLLHYSIDDGRRWRLASRGLTSEEIFRVGEYCDILLYQPFQCCYDTIKIRLNTMPVSVQRPIDIPSVEGVTTYPLAGRYYVEGHKHFSFTATYDKEVMDVIAESYYSHKKLNLSETAEQLGQLGTAFNAGAYEYTIYYVTEPWTISFVPRPTSSDSDSDENIPSDRVWTSGNTLYINVGKPCAANIYTLTGALYRQTEVNGSATLQLPQGFYIVYVDGKQYKIAIR